MGTSPWRCALGVCSFDLMSLRSLLHTPHTERFNRAKEKRPLARSISHYDLSVDEDLVILSAGCHLELHRLREDIGVAEREPA